jgi:hypothetical protein
MEKVIAVPDLRVRDLGGLYYDLRKSGFLVLNVGSDQFATYVHLEPDEEKDPTSLVEAWSQKPAPVITRKMLESRKQEAQQAEEAARTASAAASAARVAREAAEAEEIQASMGAGLSIDGASSFEGAFPRFLPAPEPPPAKDSLIARILRKLW